MPATASAAPPRSLGRPRGWQLAALLLCVPTLVPLGAALWSWSAVDAALLEHLRSYVLPAAVANTAILLLLVLVGVLVVGVVSAGLVALTDFPGRALFSFLLLLPLALPGYVVAIAFLGLLDQGGGFLPGLPEWMPEVRNRYGLSLVLTASLYPYVFLITREAFQSQGLRAIEAARSVGLRPHQAFVKVALPLALPWIAAGASLALMEVLADFGTVAAFNHDTLSVAIYKAWYGLFSPQSALQIASLMLVFVVVLLTLEAQARKRMRFTAMGVGSVRRLPLPRRGRWLATAWCSAVFLLAFGLPVSWLVWAGLQHLDLIDARFIEWAKNSALLALMGAALVVVAATFLATSVHIAPSPALRTAQRIATLGYAFPGALLAVGIYVPLSQASQSIGGGLAASLAGGGVALLLAGYAVRFMAVAHAPVASSTMRLSPSILDSARLSGMPRGRILATVYWPTLRRSMAVGTLLVFVDIMKEMPITLMMRPFGWDTLATRVFEYTSEGQWEQAAVPALLLIAVGIIPVWLLQRQTGQNNDTSHA